MNHYVIYSFLLSLFFGFNGSLVYAYHWFFLLSLIWQTIYCRNWAEMLHCFFCFCFSFYCPVFLFFTLLRVIMYLNFSFPLLNIFLMGLWSFWFNWSLNSYQVFLNYGFLFSTCFRELNLKLWLINGATLRKVLFNYASTTDWNKLHETIFVIVSCSERCHTKLF